MTNNSAGIYYLHRVVQLYFKHIFNDIKKGTFFGMILIYFICHLICLSGERIFYKTTAINLFA